MEGDITRPEVPPKPRIGDLNAFLGDIHERYIMLEPADLQLKRKVATEMLQQLHDKMKAVDVYYQRHASNITGSRRDLDIKKPNECRVYVMIDTPLNMSSENDIIIKRKRAGSAQLFVDMPTLNNLNGHLDASVYRKFSEWISYLDEKSPTSGADARIGRDKFIDWFSGIVGNALNEFKRLNDLPVFIVDGVTYKIRWSFMQKLFIESDGFMLKVTLQPVLKFPEDEWIGGEGYRTIPTECCSNYLMVVPVLDDVDVAAVDSQYLWRISLLDQEDQMVNSTQHLWLIVRLLKKFCTAQRINIKSYHIKTLVLWEISRMKNIDSSFWERNDVATLFECMLLKLYEALDKGSLPYFWNNESNLIGHLETKEEDKYKIIPILNVLQEEPCEYRSVARCLLTPEEYQEYRHSL